MLLTEYHSTGILLSERDWGHLWGTSTDSWSVSQHLARSWWGSKGCWARGVEAVFLNANQSLWRHMFPQSFSPPSSHLSFFSSGGSECSGLHVLNRCVGIGENIKVKRKGAQKTPGNFTTCLSIYVWGSQGRRDLFAYTGEGKERKRQGYLFILCVRVCIFLFIHVFLLLLRHVCFMGVILQNVFILVCSYVKLMWIFCMFFIIKLEHQVVQW